jgi:hypothetical protein
MKVVRQKDQRTRERERREGILGETQRGGGRDREADNPAPQEKHRWDNSF